VNSYRYRVTVEALTNGKGEPTKGQALSFEVTNHEDILGIVERMRARLPFDADTIASLGVGLKLFSGVTLAQRHDPMFAMIGPPLNEFSRGLKERSAAEAPASLGRLL
jgi:Domain of Unknown Function with PDB structure (DUF3861)